ncbi:hypothetical protein VCRA2117O328_10248 [Vibrio crassostreae]|nr:hypothetical protein VCRA2117O328_10248 [Vibrio crassostreae]
MKNLLNHITINEVKSFTRKITENNNARLNVFCDYENLKKDHIKNIIYIPAIDKNFDCSFEIVIGFTQKPNLPTELRHSIESNRESSEYLNIQHNTVIDYVYLTEDVDFRYDDRAYDYDKQQLAPNLNLKLIKLGIDSVYDYISSLKISIKKRIIEINQTDI